LTFSINPYSFDTKIENGDIYYILDKLILLSNKIYELIELFKKSLDFIFPHSIVPKSFILIIPYKLSSVFKEFILMIP